MLNEILNNLKKYPDDECYQIKDKIYLNRELYRYICNIYNYLLENNKEKKKVIVYGHKEIYMLATFLACSFAGITYVPLDMSIPNERIDKITSQLKDVFIVDNNIEKIMIEPEYKEISEIYMQDDDIYYIIFTSGSTGEPKGVKITYNNVKSCMKWLKKICCIDKGIVLNQANYSFDLSVADVYLPLLTRSKHFILERKIQNNFIELFENLKKSKATLAVITPSFADLLLLDKSFNKDLMPNLKKIVFCGEQLNYKTVSNLYERFPNMKIINSYGPTECTFAVTSCLVKKEKNISIGKPKDDVDIYIVNNKLEKLPENEIGEILIVGESVGAGYVNNVKNKAFITFENRRAYLTGDLGYKKEDNFYIIGRKDDQIKYKGYRIELAEIENVLNSLDYIEKAVVSTIKKDNKIMKIIAFVTIKNNLLIRELDIKKDIEKKLPNYMIPVIKVIENMPLNINGKIDRKKLIEVYNDERKNFRNNN